MSLEIKHVFVSAKAPGPDASKVRSGDWNALLDATMIGPAVLGRTLPGRGPVTALSATAAGLAVLAAADAAAQRAALGFQRFEASLPATTGTQLDFTGIPAGINRVTLQFTDVSTNGTAAIIVQLGTPSGVEATNYLGSAARLEASPAYANLSSGFEVPGNVATAVRHGTLTLVRRPGGNVWTAEGKIARSDIAGIGIVAGYKSLAGVLDRVRITTVGGSNVFDGGTINIIGEAP